MRRLFIGTLLAAILFPQPPAIGASNGSAYSRYGVGELSLYLSSRSSGMGGAGLALLTDGYINRLNPAALSRIASTRFEGDFQYRGYQMDDGSGTSYLSSGNFQGAALAFPISTRLGLVFEGSVTPYSTVAYSIHSAGTEAGIGYTKDFSGSGGLTLAQLALSFVPAGNLSIGASANYLFGTMHHRQSIGFGSGGYFASASDSVVSADGFNGTIGAVYTGVDQALGLSKEKNLNLALTLTTATSLDAQQSVHENFVTYTDSIVAAANGSIELPMTIGLGAAYLLDGRTILAADLAYANWSAYRYFHRETAEYRTSVRLGAGAEFLPVRTPGEGFFDLISYRLGAYYYATPLSVNGEALNEYGVTAGTTLPISSAGGEMRLVLGVEYGIRGAVTTSLQKESVIRFTVAVTASELFWFIPPTID